MIRALLIAATLVGLLAAGHSNAELDATLVGRPIAAVTFDSPVPIDEETLLESMPLVVGEPLREVDLDAAIAFLEAKETFSDVAVEPADTPHGASIRFRVRPVEWILGVSIEGASAVAQEDVRRRSRLREGEALRAARLEEGVRRVRELYASRGYVDAEIEATVDGVTAGTVNVRLRISEGAPVQLARVDFAVRGDVEESRLRRLLPFEIGDVWAEDSLGRGEAALRRWLRRNGYFEANISALESIDGKEAVPRYVVAMGPKSILEVQGNQVLSKPALLSLLELETRPIVTQGTWRELARRMQRRYQEEGYLFARVDLVIEDKASGSVTFKIEEGPKIHVDAIEISGNHALSDGDVRAVMETRPETRFGWGGGVFLDDVFVRDLERIRDRYRAEGYLDFRIADLRLDPDLDAGSIAIEIVLVEGIQSRLAEVRVLGIEGELGGVGGELGIAPGDPFRSGEVEEAKALILERLNERGHPDARASLVTSLRRSGDGGTSVDLAFEVAPGEEVHVGRVVVQHNYYTRDRVVRRELDLDSGDRLDSTALVEAQGRIYRLGLFRSVAVTTEGGSGPVRDVYLRVAERPGGELQYGFGYNTEIGVRNFVEVSHRNLWGTGRGVSLRGDLNLAPSDLEPDEYLGDLGMREPRLFDGRWDGRANAIAQRSERNVDEFSIRRYTFSAGAEREFLVGLRGTFLLEFDDSDIFDVAPDAVLTGKDVGHLRTVSFNPILVYDGRDDAFAPTRGVLESLRVRYGSPTLGSEVHFVKVTGQHTHYVPLANDMTWIYAIRGGIAEPLGSSSGIPLRERFFLGGRTTVRGFEENEIGPRGDAGNPIGGDLLISGNTEIRFPLFYGVGGAVFFDAGGLFLRERAVAIGEVRESAGPGLRYQTPIGALGLDYGFKVDRRGDETIGEIHFSIGNVF